MTVPANSIHIQIYYIAANKLEIIHLYNALTKKLTILQPTSTVNNGVPNEPTYAHQQNSHY